VSFTYDVTTPRGQVRLLLNDVDAATAVFQDAEIDAFLALEGASVKLAAAQAIDTNATNEALASKVIKDHQQQTDGAKVADAMRKHAQRCATRSPGTTTPVSSRSSTSPAAGRRAPSRR
jgi:hypothetical protein